MSVVGIRMKRLYDEMMGIYMDMGERCRDGRNQRGPLRAGVVDG